METATGRGGEKGEAGNEREKEMRTQIYNPFNPVLSLLNFNGSLSFC